MRRFLLAASILLAQPANAEQVTIKLGTMAPSGSTWHQRLQEMGERWAEASGGRVRLRIYPGGVQGSEGDMLRKIAVGQLDAASVTNIGLHDVAPEPQAVTVPLLFESTEELQYVFSRVQPRLDAALERHGLVPLHWALVGEVRFFCTTPYRTPSEMTAAKVFAWEGDPAAAQAWRAAGLRPVVLSSIDLVPALQTGMIDCVANVPAYVLAARVFEKAHVMIAVPWGYVMGATVVAKRAWSKVPAEARPSLLEIARDLGRRVDADARSADAEAIVAMRKQGLSVLLVHPEPWRRAAEAGWGALRGKVVPADLFDEVKRLRDQYRAEHVAAQER